MCGPDPLQATVITYEPLSKLLVSPLTAPIVVPYIIPYIITPFKEFRLWPTYLILQTMTSAAVNSASSTCAQRPSVKKEDNEGMEALRHIFLVYVRWTPNHIIVV